MQLKRGLGRGLDSLLPPPVIEKTEKSQDYRKLSLQQIVPNRLQPRTYFDEEKIRELAESIKEQGVIQPLIVSPLADGRYELIAGERRLRASRLAGLEEVPVVIKKVDDEGLLALSILENIQREDLNPLEEARAYQELTEQFGYTQEDVAKKLGKSRSAVANCIRLLNLPKLIQEDISSGRYSAGHARAMLSLPTLHDQLKFRERIMNNLPTVRDVENMVQSFLGNARRPTKRKIELPSGLTEITNTLKSKLGTKVELQPKGNGGKLVIEYYSAADLDRIYKTING